MFTLSQTTTPFIKDMVALTKPRITLMTLLLAGGGMVLAPHSLSMWKAAWALLGIALLVSGSSAFNMYIERDYDGLMARTQDRPLPAGRLAPLWALIAGWFLSLAAVPALIYATNPLTAALGVFSLVSYVLIYTPMKRMSSLALVVGAIPGAMPALLGYTAASNHLDTVGVALFVVAFLWQLPHFIAISIFRQKEYVEAGYPVVPEFMGRPWAKNLTVATSFLVVTSSLWLWVLHVGQGFYLLSCLALGLWFLSVNARGFFSPDVDGWARKVFYASLVYQVLLFVALAIDVMMQRLL